jgi:hypothetical protein
MKTFAIVCQAPEVLRIMFGHPPCRYRVRAETEEAAQALASEYYSSHHAPHPGTLSEKTKGKKP